MGIWASAKVRVLIILLLLIVLFQTCKLYSEKMFAEKEVELQSLPRKLIEIAVYYEALCPDSRHFFIHHLKPTHAMLKNDLFLNLIPYGKAKTFVSSNGNINFECQHGEVECYANKIHACTIETVSDLTKQLDIVTCMIKDNLDPEGALALCVPPDINSVVLNCAKGTQGSVLLKKYGEFTKIVKPTFIPTVYIDGLKGDQGALLKNFMSEVCKYYPDLRKPPSCS